MTSIRIGMIRTTTAAATTAPIPIESVLAKAGERGSVEHVLNTVF